MGDFSGCTKQAWGDELIGLLRIVGSISSGVQARHVLFLYAFCAVNKTRRGQPRPES